jgi:PAS domain S-box-containing protein
MCRTVEMASPSTTGIGSNPSFEADLFVAAAFEPLPIAVATTDVHGTVRSVNAALTSLTGYSSEEVVGHPVTLLSFGTAKRSVYDILQDVIRSREPWRGECVWRRRTGDLFTAEQTVASILSTNGEILRVAVTIEDIAGRKQVDEELVNLLATQAQRDFDRFFNLIPDLACIVSTDGYFKKVNPAWEQRSVTRMRK